MKKIGVSIYPAKSTFEENKRYLDQAKKYGFSRIFTSLLEIEGDTQEVIAMFKEIIRYGNSIDMETVLDINPNLFGQLNISYDDLSFFHDMGASGIRLDLGFSGAEESLMSKNNYQLQIEVNMSSGTNYIDQVMSFHPNIELLTASHNFYPQRYSGLAQDHFERTTQQFNQHRLHTAAFVTSQEGELGPWPVQSGLCTLEAHRDLPIATQVSHYQLMNSIDDLLIGNAFASEEELEAMSKAFFSAHPQIPIQFNDQVSAVEKEVISKEIHQYRGDRSAYMIRSSQTRVKYKNSDFSPHSTGPIAKGDVLICNDTMGQYKGETQIALKEISDDGSRNIVAKIPAESLFLLDYVKPWSTFVFVEK
ncbi:DUF871 domain-containing protein [Lacticigenium naphthae]|uniref:DUF871 domain-containing protein n=1 Tax=Lacticigenium naphthae TaxID=515351 RepID=UPI0003FAD01E|nr:MupG family TIM beta-alpha barrel fold protein [Lacticigenium naphthae]